MTVLCILANELAVGANSVEVLFLATLPPPAPTLPTSLEQTLPMEGLPSFLTLMELAAVTREPPVPVPLALDLVPDVPVDSLVAMLLVLDLCPGSRENDGIGAR